MVDFESFFPALEFFKSALCMTQPITTPPSLGISVELRGAVALVTLMRANKRNALNDALVLALEYTFTHLPAGTRAAVIAGDGDHFCAGLDLSELQARSTIDGLHHSRMWHRAFNAIEKGSVPVVAALHGAVVGGGMELASSCHIRVADETAFFAFPEGSRGIFVGGGGSVRAPKLIGEHRMLDMMLTGRVYKAAEAVPLGFAQYLVAPGQALAKAMELAQRIATNAEMTNYALMHALPRIAEQTADHGFFTEALMASIVETAPEAQQRVKDFLEGRGAKVKAD
jgi:(methylthio)acryloyl-CoA hydratase